MEKTKCWVCGNTTFEIVPLEIKGANFPFSVIRCSNCKNAISITESSYIPQLIKDINSQIKQLQNQISTLTRVLDSLTSRMK